MEIVQDGERFVAAGMLVQNDLRFLMESNSRNLRKKRVGKEALGMLKMRMITKKMMKTVNFLN